MTNLSRAIWIEAQGRYSALASLVQLQQAWNDLKKIGPTDLMVQVYREGRPWFPSTLADDTPHKRVTDAGFDPLAYFLQQTENTTTKIHAWINVFNLGHNQQAPFLQNHHEHLLTDCRGIPIDKFDKDGYPPDDRKQFFCIDTPGLWLDPASAVVRQYIINLTCELFATYPSLAGIHLDFIRYPYFLPLKPSSRIPVGSDFGYSKDSLSSFSKQHDLTEPFVVDTQRGFVPRTDAIALMWDQWRRAQIEELLRELRKNIPSGKKISVAALAWPERAYFTAFQNWRRWLQHSIVDMVCLMSYTADDELFRYLVQQASAFQTETSKLLGGIGTYLLEGIEQIKSQLRLAEQANSAGLILFSYGNLKRMNVDFGELKESFL